MPGLGTTFGRGAATNPHMDLKTGYTVRVWIDAFVTAPRPGRYRISNDLPATVRVEGGKP